MDIKKFLDDVFQSRKPKRTYYTYGYQEEYRKNENASLGYIPFMRKVSEITSIIPKTNPNNRTGLKRDKTYYIVIHDTASAAPSANGVAHQKWLMSMASDPNSTYAVSWHYSVDENCIHNHIPNNEVAYHAGDGTKISLEFSDTLVKYSKDLVTFEINDDLDILINNQNTFIKAPAKATIPTLGFNVIKGENGNFYISNLYYNQTYKTVANRGGNLNSIGIETCVNYGSDYIVTMMNTAYLCAKLLIEYDLGIDAIKQHNHFSGKDCPMTMRKNEMWDEFINLVLLNLEYLNNFSNIEFIPLTEGINEFGIITKVQENYKYLVKYNDQEFVYEFKNE